MAYLDPHFDPDVFVSYSHGDPRGMGASPLKDWTHGLIKQLESQILSLDPEFDNLKVWMDPELDPTAHLTPELRTRVGKSAVLMIVMSKRYLNSSWCRDELEWFRAQIKDREGDAGRVFVIRAQPTDAAAWPEFLRDERGHSMLGFTFFDPASGMPLGWPDLQEPGREFTKELCRLQTALTKRLRELRDRAQKRQAAEAVARAPAALPGGARRVYLYAPPEGEADRAGIGKTLSSEGILPFSAQNKPGTSMADWQRDANARIETAKRCDALALLRVDDGDRFVGDLIDIGVDERERIADARGAPLPCAVLDKSGASLPIDVAPFGIERFDVTKDDWRGAFRAWLDAARAKPAGAAT